MDISKHLDMNPKIMMGKPIIRGTRIPAELILRKLGEGATEKELCEAYPRLTIDDIRAVMIFAADMIAHDELVMLTPSEGAYKENALSC